MALLMVHLLAAERWAQAHEEYRDCPDFYLGAISPDAIHIRDKNDKSHKNEIHLNNWTSPHVEEVLRYWRAYHSPFDIGYGIHVLTDAQWVPRYRERIPQLLLPEGRTDTKAYYHDTYLTDYELYRDHEAGKRLFGWVERGCAPENHPLLTRYELSEWQKRMTEIYRGECPEQGTPKYIDRKYVEAFLGDCQEMFCEIYGRYSNERGSEGDS